MSITRRTLQEAALGAAVTLVPDEAAGVAAVLPAVAAGAVAERDTAGRCATMTATDVEPANHVVARRDAEALQNPGRSGHQ